MSEENLQNEAKGNIDIPASVSEQPSMLMDDFHCNMFELNFEFAREALDEPAFLKAIEELEADEYADDGENIEVTLSFGSRSQPPKPHAHLTVKLNKEGKGNGELRFHNSTMENINERLPLIEDCTRWFGEFFKNDTVTAHQVIVYIFDESFERTINLPFPLVTSEKALAGSLVMGIAILLPEEQLVETATMQATPKGGTYLFFTTTKREMKLKDFNLSAELERLSPSVDTFVKRQDADVGKNNK